MMPMVIAKNPEMAMMASQDNIFFHLGPAGRRDDGDAPPFFFQKKPVLPARRTWWPKSKCRGLLSVTMRQ
jgi:hypothetical protein